MNIFQKLGNKTFIPIIALAILIRGYCFVVAYQNPTERFLEEDSIGFRDLATSIVSGDGFGRPLKVDTNTTSTWAPELARTPGYPTVLALMKMLTQNEIIFIVIFQHMIGIALCAAVTLVCVKLGGSTSGLIAGFLMATDLQGAALGTMVLSETVFSVFLVAACYLTANLIEKPSIWIAVTVGLMMAASAFIKPTTLFLPILVALFIATKAIGLRSKKLFSASVTLIISSMIPIVIWVIRNGQSAGEYTFSVIPRYQLLMEHAAGTISQVKDI